MQECRTAKCRLKGSRGAKTSSLECKTSFHRSRSNQAPFSPTAALGAVVAVAVEAAAVVAAAPVVAAVVVAVAADLGRPRHKPIAITTRDLVEVTRTVQSSRPTVVCLLGMVGATAG